MRYYLLQTLVILLLALPGVAAVRAALHGPDEERSRSAAWGLGLLTAVSTVLLLGALYTDLLF